MNTIKTFLLIVAAPFFLISCKKKSEAPGNLSGTWIETKNRADTLVFMHEKMLDLRRGKAVYNGNLLPKAWSGLYTYHLKQDSIGLRYTLSSNSNQPTYQFFIESNQIHIGDFYQKDPSQNTLLIFERLK
jgi:hypothetical protein